MPGGDGTGPQGKGPISGRGLGFCMLKIDTEKPSSVKGFAGIDGTPVRVPMNETSAAAKALAVDQSLRQAAAGRGKKEVSKMPGGDGTGPAGMGPMTGRAAGYCAGYPMPGFMNPIAGSGFGWGGGRGYGRGRGRGMGFGFRGGRGWAGYGGPAYGVPYGYGGALPIPYGATTGAPYGVAPTSQQELDALKGQSEYLEDALDGIRKRIKDLETEAKK